MKALTALLIGIVFSFGFTSEEQSYRSISPLVGKWIHTGTDIDGVRDTTQSDLKVLYYEFGTDNSFETSWIRNSDTTTYRIGGRYKTGKSATRVTIYHYDKNKTKTTSEVQILTYSSMNLIDVRKVNGKKTTYVSHFERVR